MGKIIKLIEDQPAIIEDQWIVKRDMESKIQPEAVSQQIVPFPYYKNLGSDERDRQGVRAIWIAPDDEFEPMTEELCKLSLIAVDFPSFRDGRGYSIGYLLRSRYGWIGELRAIGDVLRDQLNYMRRCGFDAFAVRADKNIDDAVKSFHHYSVQYQGAIDEPLPLFRRRQ